MAGSSMAMVATGPKPSFDDFSRLGTLVQVAEAPRERAPKPFGREDMLFYCGVRNGGERIRGKAIRGPLRRDVFDSTVKNVLFARAAHVSALPLIIPTLANVAAADSDVGQIADNLLN